MCEKHLWKSDIIDDLYLYLQCLSSQVFFTDFAGESHQPGFSVSGPLTENGLKETLHGNVFCSGKIFTFKHDSYSRGPVV